MESVCCKLLSIFYLCQKALSKTCWDTGTTSGVYNRQRRGQRRRDSRDTVLSETVVQWVITTIQAGTTLQRRWSRDNRQPFVQHHMLFRTIWRSAVSIKDNNTCLLMLLLELIKKNYNINKTLNISHVGTKAQRLSRRLCL